MHEAIGASVRSAAVNHVDKTSWQQAGAIQWLWTMTNCEAGRLSGEILREIDTLWVFLNEAGVEPINHRAERALRFAVLWRNAQTAASRASRSSQANPSSTALFFSMKTAAILSASFCIVGRAGSSDDMFSVGWMSYQPDLE